MYIHDELTSFEIPTATETREEIAAPNRICPDTPDRECLLRHLYAVKKNQNIQCAICGPMSSKVSKFRATQKKCQELSDKKIEDYRINPKKERKELSLDEIEARRNRALAALKKAREANEKRKVLAKEFVEEMQIQKKEMTPREKASLKIEKKRLKRAQESVIKEQASRKASEISMRLVRSGGKVPSRVQAVVLLLEEMLANGQCALRVTEFLHRVNNVKGLHKISTSGAMGRVLRDYGLTVRVEYNPQKKNHIATFYLDDKAKEFIAGDYFYHEHGNNKFKPR